MIVHKLLFGDGAAKYLPFGLSRLRALEALNPEGFFSQTYMIEDAVINVRQIGKQQFLEITAGVGVAYFEFFTTGFPLSLGANPPLYNCECVGTTITAKGGVAKASPNLLGGKHDPYGANLSAVKRMQQGELLDEPVHYPGPQNPITKGWPRALYQAYAPTHSHSGVYTRAYACGSLPLSSLGIPSPHVSMAERDKGYDMPWVDGTGKDPVRTAYLNNEADWPRRSGVQKVVDPVWGTREFAIYVDAFDQVSVFPTSQIGPQSGTTQNVDPLYVKYARVPFPAWVYAKTQRYMDWAAANPGSTDDRVDFPEIDWRMHPDGTKMCAVVHERAEAVFDSGFFATYATDTGTLGPVTYFPDDSTMYDLKWQLMGWPEQNMNAWPSVSTDKWYHVAPGLLEVEIRITLTGTNLYDYDLVLVPFEVRRPTTSQYCGLMAGYVWHDVGKKGVTAKRGDLCVLDIELYGNNTALRTAQLWSVKNITKNTEIMTFGACSFDSVTTVGPGKMLNDETFLLAANMETLSFVTRPAYIEVGSDPSPYAHSTFIQHWGVGVYVMGKYQTTLYPTTMVQAAQDLITETMQDADARLRMSNQIPDLQLMPLNDLRGWGDADLDNLREYYLSDYSAPTGTYAGPVNPLNNINEIETKGHCYYGPQVKSTPSTYASNWYNSLMCAGGRIRPFGIFYLTEPRPGWYLYASQAMTKMYNTGHTTFFSYPNGSWALFDQTFFYNSNPIQDPYIVGMKIYGSTISDLNTTKVEHCIFDKIFIKVGDKSPAYLSTTFLKLYNDAVTKLLGSKTQLEDGTRLMATDYSDFRAKVTKSALVDPYDATISYAQLDIDWGGVVKSVHDTGFYDGGKDSSVGYDSIPTGKTTNFSLQLPMDDGEPMMLGSTPLTFSSCLLVIT